MPYKLSRVSTGYKVCLKSDPKKCFSKKGLPLERAKKQEKAIILSEHPNGPRTEHSEGSEPNGPRTEHSEGSGFIARTGGKTKLVKKIISFFPSDYPDLTYVEPFIGGGSILYAKEPSKVEVINDLDSDLITYYKGLKKFPQERITEALKKYSNTRENFKKVLEAKPSDDFAKFIRQVILFKGSFYSQGKTWSGDNNNWNTDFTKKKERLKDVVVLNKSFESVVKEYDSSKTLFYLDPPYEKSEGLYSHDSLPISKVFEVLKNLKGKWILSYNNSEEAKELFKNYNVFKVKTKYEKPGGSGQRTVTELVITNFKEGSGNFDTFKEQLDKAGVKEKDYLSAAKAAAKKAGYNPEKVFLAEDNNHKLLYDGEHGLRKFGKVGYSDYLIYTLSPLVTKKEAEKHRLSYHKRFNKSALYEKDSPYLLSLRILW